MMSDLIVIAYYKVLDGEMTITEYKKLLEVIYELMEAPK